MRLQTYINEASIRAAFFISPNGDIIPVDINHIATIIKHPKKFGLTKDYIQSIYDKHNEKFGVEGRAREEIIVDLVKNGWVRIRRYPTFWSIQIDRLTKKIKDYLYDWSVRVQKGIMGFRERDKYIPVKIIPLESNNYSDIKMIPIDKIAHDALYNESEIHYRRDVLVERSSIEDLQDIEEYTLNEAGYSRLMRVMGGLIPAVKTFIIVTWENPMGKERSTKFNKEANESLRSMLKRGNFSYRHIEGRYGNFENPFIVFNVSLNTAKNIGFDHEKYKQESIIYGKRYSEKQKEGMIYRMMYSDNRAPLERRIWRSLKKGTEDIYSEYKGRKFIIPFFDDEFIGKKFDDGKIVDENGIFYRNNVPQNVIDELNSDVDDIFLDEQTSGYSLYINRGKLLLELSKLQRGML